MLAELVRDTGRAALRTSPLTGVLLQAAADDVAAGGITAAVLAGCELDPPGSVPGLRLAAALHRLVLARRAPRLALHYPSAGGTPRLDTLWRDASPVLSERAGELNGLVHTTPVQTNEPGRMGPLHGGLLVASLRAGGLPVRLLEVGASGGLNLHPDRIALVLGDGAVLGDPASPLRLDAGWSGRPPADLGRPLRIVERAGCDPHPVDVTTPEGRLSLSSFVWPDAPGRWERLRAALALAAAHPVPVERAEGADWLAGRLAAPVPGVLTVVWHSVVWQYASAESRARGRQVLAAAASTATADAPLALLVYESRRTAPGRYRFDLVLRQWPGGRRTPLGSGAGHGVPFTWA